MAAQELPCGAAPAPRVDGAPQHYSSVGLEVSHGARLQTVDLEAAARKMSAAELKRTIAGTQATLRRGESALKSLRALAAKQAKSKG